mmetsp:Transcript_45/g.133  ORF Transcript_45/g.133 Transcript_45/m.133 type:complete len:204 (+) Transcript_45:57-668(+)
MEPSPLSAEGHWAKVLLLGMEGSGKTTASLQMSAIEKRVFHLEERRTLNSEAVPMMYDIGGRCSARPYWRSGIEGKAALIFLVDCTDRQALEFLRYEVMYACDYGEGAPVLIFANKQDVSGACDTEEVKESLGLDSLNTRPLKKHHLEEVSWHVCPCIATKGEGIHQGFQWLAKTLWPEKYGKCSLEATFSRSGWWSLLKPLL